jgi:hypothetical protein
MDPLREYAQFWLERTAVRLGQPNWHRLNRYWIENIESGRPGFAAQLRLVALDALGSEDATWAEKGVAALAVVGHPEDLDRLAAYSERRGGAASKNARTAIFEIEHRVAAT